ncbi:MAG: hypothetical protein FJ290_18050 [Planctomycetes bacterium]|nr:hypothetical protein [Planctomycetota bacterium]
MYARFIALVSLVATLCAPHVLAYSVRCYDFVELSMESDAIVLAKSVAPAGNQLEVSVREVLYGRAATGSIKVAFEPEWRAPAPQEIKTDRLVFLAAKDGQLALFGAGTQAIWPQEGWSGQYHCPYKSARDVELLAKTCKQIRGLPSLDEAKRAAAVGEMVGSDDPFLKLVGMQLCSWLGRKDARKHARELDLGSAQALAYLSKPIGADLLLFYQAVALSGAAPPSAALRRLIRVVEHPSVAAVQRNNASMELAKIARGHGAEVPSGGDVTPEARLTAVRKWLSTAWRDLVAGDAGTILDALKSPEPSRRAVGRAWLEALAGQSFGFSESADGRERAAAILEAETWITGQRTGRTPSVVSEN